MDTRLDYDIIAVGTKEILTLEDVANDIRNERCRVVEQRQYGVTTPGWGQFCPWCEIKKGRFNFLKEVTRGLE